jgi:hypothetical protein
MIGFILAPRPVPIVLRKRAYWRRIVRLPRLMRQYHRLGLPWIASARAALLTVTT